MLPSGKPTPKPVQEEPADAYTDCVDNLIAKHLEAVRLLEKMKKGYLQQRKKAQEKKIPQTG